MRILFVCMGNICRSPSAEAVFTKMADGMGFTIDSAGTADWHTGNPPDYRAISTGSDNGYDLADLRARQVNVDDFENFDLILAMDESNLADLKSIAPANHNARLELFLNYAPDLGLKNVPDPYYNDNFTEVLRMIESASEGLIEALKAQ